MLATVTRSLARRPFLVGAAALVAVLLLAVPLLTMPPTSFASQEPGGPAFDARDLAEDRLAPDIAPQFVLLEARDGDLLDPEDLRELQARVTRLRDDPATSALLADGFDRDLDVAVEGVVTLADVVDRELAGLGGIADAPDEAVRAAVDAVVDEAGPGALGLSQDAEVTADGHWRAPAITVVVQLDNDALGGGVGGVQVGGDTAEREELLRDVRDVLRGGAPGDRVERDDAGPIVAHAVAADVNLTSEEQGQAAGPFIGLTVLLTLLLVGAVFRSAWTVAVVGTGIAGLMIWLQGWSNLLGLEQDQILATVVPIALVSFGIDFAFHAVGRVEEERAAGRPPRGALAIGLAGVGGALLLALGSDVAAFLANTVSGIESIVQFGVAAAIGLTGAFLLLGVVAPTVLAGIADRVPPPAPGRRPALARIVAAVAAAVVTTTSVLLTVYVAPAAGVATFAALGLLGVAVPAWLAGRRTSRQPVEPLIATPPAPAGPGPLARGIGAGVAWVARRGAVVLPTAVLVTAVAVVAALQVETRFDVEDFFAEDTDFVAGLEAVDAHVGDNGGEPTEIVVTADVTDPRIAARLAAEVDALRGLDDRVLARGPDGTTLVDGGVVDVLRFATSTPPVAAAVEGTIGVALTDADGDGIPDTSEGIDAVLRAAADDGLAVDGEMVWSPQRVTSVFDRTADDVATVIGLQLPGSREVTVIVAATDLLQPRVDALRDDLAALDPAASVELTGAPIVRQLSLDAVTRSLLLSLPIAVLLCLVVAASVMRSLRTALVAIVPILLVVPWLYGAMWAGGFAVNLVTGTIGAISIGIGIDFAIHLVARYREEHGHRGDRDAAMRATGEGTGVALVASASSSVLGFAVLAFAPMPMFAAYGLLTAVMIAMALVATLVVLPPLLRLTSRDVSLPTEDREALVPA